MERELRNCEVRSLVKIVAMAVWARMRGGVVGLEKVQQAWIGNDKLLVDAFAAAKRHVPEVPVRGQRVDTGGEAPTARGINTSHAWVDAFNALEGMPLRDGSQPIEEVCLECFRAKRLTSGGIGKSPCPYGHAAEHDTVKICYEVVDVTMLPDWEPGDPV